MQIFLQNTFYSQGIISTIVVIIMLFALRWLALRAITRNKNKLTATQRNWINSTRTLTVLLIAFALVFIWMPELSQFAFSIAAFAAALILATKELILTITGALWRAVSRPFVVGDWIEINLMRGEVIEMNLMSTKLMELASDSQFTGRILTLPNSQLLAYPVANENYRRRYSHIAITLIAEKPNHPLALMRALQDKVDEECVEFVATTKKFISALEGRIGMDLPSAMPVVHIGTNEQANVTYTVRLFCPVEKREELEVKVTDTFFSLLYKDSKMCSDI